MSKDQKRMSFKKGYNNDGLAEKVYHLHLRMFGDADESYFRNYINEFPIMAKEFEALKIRLAEKFKYDRDGYTQA